MERRAAGSEEADDGGEAAPCRVQTRIAASGHCEKGAGRGGKGEDATGRLGWLGVVWSMCSVLASRVECFMSVCMFFLCLCFCSSLIL